MAKLADSGVAFDAVADLCEMSARQDELLKRHADGAPVKIAACYPRAVKWLFHAAKASLKADTTEVINMRLLSADEVCKALFNDELTPNLPAGKVSSSDAPKTALNPA